MDPMGCSSLSTTPPAEKLQPGASVDTVDTPMGAEKVVPPLSDKSVTPLQCRKTEAVSGQNYLEQFDLECHKIARKIERYSMPSDFLLEQGTRAAKKKGKSKSSGAEASAPATYCLNPALPSPSDSPDLRQKTKTGPKVKQSSEDERIITFSIPELEAHLKSLQPKGKSPSKMTKKQKEEYKRKTEILNEYEYFRKLAEVLMPIFVNYQKKLDTLSPEEKSLQWQSPTYQSLHVECINLMAEISLFLNEHPDSDVLKKDSKAQVVVNEKGNEQFYRSMIQIRKLLLLNYSQCAQCFSYKILKWIKEQFLSENMLKGLSIDGLLDDFTSVSCCVYQALNQVSYLLKAYKQIDGPDSQQQSVMEDAGRVLNKYYALVSEVVIRGQFQRLELMDRSRGEEAEICGCFLTRVCNECCGALSKENILLVIRKLDCFFQPTGDTVVECMESQCQRVITAGFLGSYDTAINGVKELAKIAERATTKGDLSYVYVSRGSLHEPRRLIFEQTMRSSISIFVWLYKSLSDDEEPGFHRMKLKDLDQTAESMAIWWNSVFPPDKTPELDRSREVLKGISRDARESQTRYEERIENHRKAVEKIADSLIQEEEAQRKKIAHRAERLKKLVEKRTGTKASGESGDFDENQEEAVESLQGATAELSSFETHKNMLGKACDLMQGNSVYANEEFIKVLKQKELAEEHRIWALYGCANCCMEMVNQHFRNQSDEARKYLEDYESEISQGKLPSSRQGGEFHQKLETFRNSLKELYRYTMEAQNYFKQLIDIILGKGSVWLENTDLVAAIAEGMADCRAVIKPLSNFSPRLSTLYRNRGELIRRRMQEQASGQRQPGHQVDSQKIISEVTFLTNSLTKTLDDFEQTLRQKQNYFSRAEDQGIPDLH